MTLKILAVSLAAAAAALAGIPVTHRGIASGFLVVTGHAESAYRPVLESLAPQSVTVVVLMGMASRAKLASLLLARGWAAHTPAAIVSAASHETARTWTGTLEALAGAASAEDAGDGPGTLVIGDVVSLAAELAGTESVEPAAPRMAVGQR